MPHFGFTAFDFAGLFIMSAIAEVFQSTFFVEFLFEPTQGSRTSILVMPGTEEKEKGNEQRRAEEKKNASVARAIDARRHH